MANVIEGRFSLKEVFHITNEKYKNRFTYMERDVIKRVTIKKVVSLSPDRPKEPSITYEIQTYSYPNYKPYYTTKDERGRPRRYQRKIKHQYDCILSLDRLSINTKVWKGRVGSGKTWKKPPQSMIKTIYRDTRQRLENKMSKDRLGETIRKHKKTAPYLDIGDWNSRVQGINGDFIFRCSFAWWQAGHLYGRNYYGNIPAPIRNPDNIVFFPKHFIRLIEILLERGILKDN